MVSAWYGGLGPGLLATGLSALALDFFFVHPIFALGTELADGVRLAVFVLVAVLISSLNAARRRLELELRRQDRRKAEFLAILAHELRNPLSAALSGLEVLHHQAAGNPAALRSAEVLERQVRTMTRLVNDLLDVSRINRGKIRLDRRRVDMGTAVAQAVETARPLINARGHRLEVSLPPAPLSLEADPTRLEQILVNLLTNAAKYTGPGGHIRLTAERARGQAVLRVRDTGVGLAPEVLPHVFDLFVQAEEGSQGGLGIGLNLVRSLVHLHGGTVTVSSEGPGKGSEFVVCLPLLPEASPEPWETGCPAAASR
jgi:signal transduction histidine kinase